MANKSKETFTFENRTVEVHRRAFRRTISVYLYPQRPIKVMAGRLVDQHVIYEFLLSKKDWIEKQYLKFDEIVSKIPERKIKAYHKLPFLGAEKSLRVVITLLKKSFVSLQGEEFLLHIPRNQWSADALSDEHPELLAVVRDFYKREAIKLLTERMSFWSQAMGLQPTSVKFREQRTRWGSCSSRGAINLNWRLIVFKPEIIDYVIVHELAHLRHMNHSAQFWSLVENFIPDYEVYTKELSQTQFFSEFLNPVKELNP